MGISQTILSKSLEEGEVYEWLGAQPEGITPTFPETPSRRTLPGNQEPDHFNLIFLSCLIQPLPLLIPPPGTVIIPLH